jgi:type I restriction enzyme S subunit
MKKISQKRLGELCKIIDCEHKTAPTQPEGIPLIRTPNIGQGRLILDNVQRISESTFSIWSRRAEPTPGDLIMAREAPVGNVAIILPGQRVCLGQRTVLIRVTSDELDPRFLNYLLNSPTLKGQVILMSIGATVGHLNVTDIRKLDLPPLPSLQVQRKIAAILTAYDDLIETNKRRIALLEKMAEEIYREWFVRLRFPGYQTKSLDFIPLRSLVKTYIGGGWGNEEASPEFPNRVRVIRGTDFDNIKLGDIGRVPERFIKNSSLKNRKLQAGDLIVENSVNHQSRTTGKTLLITQSILDLFDGDVICASFCKLIRPKNIEISRFLELNFRMLFCQGLFDYFQNIATNGIANLQVERFLDRNMIPFSNDIDLSLLNLLDSTVLATSINNLTKTRDLLLPRLISGKLPVEHLDIQTPPSMNP